jgi:lipopolysaccharide export system permease protein
MVFTLHRYILRELLKVFVPAAIALTLILSLGSILRPVQEYGVGPGQVVHLMGYFLPIVLTFVLPMAALFAAALVYGRFASDNELDACRASGISLLTLVYPGLALAIIVATANLILSFQVVPTFVHRAERSLKANAKQILFRNIQRKGFYGLPPESRYMIYADQANPKKNTLSGVIITEVKNNQIKEVITAERTKIYCI